MVPFSLVVLNHEQVKSSTTGSIVTCEKGNFKATTNHILSADGESMDTVIQKLSKCGQFDLSSESEKRCLDIINDRDHVAQFVQGSRTNRRYMRNEIWSIVTAHGAPSWFITFAPINQNNPISTYHGAEDPTIFPRCSRRRNTPN